MGMLLWKIWTVFDWSKRFRQLPVCFTATLYSWLKIPLKASLHVLSLCIPFSSSLINLERKLLSWINFLVWYWMCKERLEVTIIDHRWDNFTALLILKVKFRTVDVATKQSSDRWTDHSWFWLIPHSLSFARATW